MKTTNFYTTTAFLFFALFFSASLSAQVPGFKFKGINVNMGVEQDMVHNLNSSYFSDMAEGTFLSAMNNEQLDEGHFYSGICENQHYRLEALFAPVSGSPVDLRFSLNYVPNRVDALSYYSDEGGYINVNSYTDELSVGASLMRHATLGGILRVYGGIGTNLGYIFENRMFLDGDLNMSVDDMGLLNTGSDDLPEFNPNDGYTYQEQTGPNGISQRIFLTGGVAIRAFDRVELGLNLNYGYGYRKFFGGPLRGTNLVGVGLSLGYSIE